MAFVGLIVLIVIPACLTNLQKSSPTSPTHDERKFFQLDTARLRDFWHTAMVRGFIKAYTKPMLPSLPYVEKQMYGICVKQAKSTVALAKCAVQVFNYRDSMGERAKVETSSVATLAYSLPRRIFKNSTMYRTSFVPKKRKVKITDPKAYFRKHKKPTKRKTRLRRTRRLRKKKKRIKREAMKEKLRKTSPRKTQKIKKVGDALPKPREGLLPGKRPALNIGKIFSQYMRKLLTRGSRGNSYLESLRIIREHFQRIELCNQYFQRTNQENKKFFDELKLGVDTRTPEIENTALSTMKGVVQTINDFSAHTSSDQLSVLSPRLFSVVPHSPSSEKHLLSPTILSFQKEGFLSMQELFEMATMNEKQQNMLLDMIMDVTGAGKAVEETLERIKLEIDDVKNVKLPLVQELARKHDRWLRAHAKFTEEQRQEYKRNGFAFMNEDQLKLVYDSKEQKLYGINITEVSRMTKEEKMKRIERDIRKLATLDRPQPQKPVPSWGPALEMGTFAKIRRQTDWKRKLPQIFDKGLRKVHFVNAGGTSVRTRRQASGPPEGNPPVPGESEQELEERGVRINGILFQTLEPYAFEPEIGTGAALEVVTLSPHAFIPEILFPRALRQETLTPRAFIGAILSPNALMARILSPTALRLEILSPRALHAWVLSPEALLVEILSPRMLDPRVLSPMALIVEVLSPGILSPYVGSAELGSVLVLSPHVLSPRYKSPEKLVIEVLSPHILGGPHSHEEAFHQVAEFGSHSPHYHGDSSHEREEGSHHSHELDNELSLESYPGLSSITGHIRHRHGGQGDARTGELFPGLADLLGGSHAENDPLSELLGLGAHSHHNHGPTHGTHGSGETQEPRESHGSHHEHHEPELFPGLSALFGGGHGGSHEPELAGLSELFGGHSHHHGSSEHGNHGEGDILSGLSSLLFGGEHGSHSSQHTHSAHGGHAGAHSSHESHENHEESVPGLPPLIHIVNPLRQ